MHLAFFLGHTPITAQASFSFSLPKVGIPLVKINIFQRLNTIRTGQGPGSTGSTIHSARNVVGDVVGWHCNFSLISKHDEARLTKTALNTLNAGCSLEQFYLFETKTINNFQAKSRNLILSRYI